MKSGAYVVYRIPTESSQQTVYSHTPSSTNEPSCSLSGEPGYCQRFPHSSMCHISPPIFSSIWAMYSCQPLPLSPLLPPEAAPESPTKYIADPSAASSSLTHSSLLDNLPALFNFTTFTASYTRKGGHNSGYILVFTVVLGSGWVRLSIQWVSLSIQWV